MPTFKSAVEKFITVQAINDSAIMIKMAMISA
jgi:hypothetical protein